MNNFNRMTIRENGTVFSVFKMKSQQVGGWTTDMAAKKFSWFVSRIAAPRFTGTYAECTRFIESEGAEFMSEHGIAC
jgi:hypothetical protein